jgi:antitoxin (DNA-binding transcriptional repressor) of toxin-antitoxin stability system
MYSDVHYVHNRGEEPNVRVTVTEARRLLPALLKKVHDDPNLRVEITVRDEPVAELRALTPSPEPGEAVRRLLELRARLAKSAPAGDAADVSSRVKDHLYGPGGASP